MFRFAPEPGRTNDAKNLVTLELGLNENKRLLNGVYAVGKEGITKSEHWGRHTGEDYNEALQLKLFFAKVKGDGLEKVNRVMNELAIKFDDTELQTKLGISDELRKQMNEVDWLSIKLIYVMGRWGLDRSKYSNDAAINLCGGRAKSLSGKEYNEFDKPFYEVQKIMFFVGWRDGNRGEPKLGYGEDNAWKASADIKLVD